MDELEALKAAVGGVLPPGDEGGSSAPPPPHTTAALVAAAAAAAADELEAAAARGAPVAGDAAYVAGRVRALVPGVGAEGALARAAQ